MNVYLVSRYVKHGHDSHVVVAADGREAIEHVAGFEPSRRNERQASLTAELIGTAESGYDEVDTILSCVWHA